jgi:hypothetical protein
MHQKLPAWIVLSMQKGRMLMETVKPQQPNGDNAVQGVLMDLDSMEPVSGKVVLIPDKQEEAPEKKEDKD